MQDQARLTEAVRQAADPLQVMQRVADQTSALIDGAEGTLIALWDDGDALTYVCGSGYLEPYAGSRLDVASSLAGHALRSSAILRSDDTSCDPRVDADECQRPAMRSMLCVPLLRGRRTFGVMIVSSRQTAAFDTADELVLRGLADFVGVVVAAASDLDRVTAALLADDTEVVYLADEPTRQRAVGPDSTRLFMANVLTPEAARDHAARRRIEQALSPGGFSVVFQPIVELHEGTCMAFEALVRFPGEPIRPPNLWFEEAHTVGLGVELELAAVGAALRYQPDLPGDTHLAVNVGPLAMTSPLLPELLERADPRRLVIELTEQAEIRDYCSFTQAISAVRSTGARLAVDDTGAGVSSLAHILKLAPDLIKLDRALTTGVDRDPVRRALASSLVSFAEETGPLIIAEGIETAAELKMLRSLGIRYGQGFFLRAPGSLDAVLAGSTGSVTGDPE
ncbi:MAG: sensor domain-containing phosphodiesterase [Solirubrobacteraceae bacterium]